MPFFDLISRWVESSNSGPRCDDLSHLILESDFIPSDFAKSDCISRPIFFSDRTIKIRSSESDRIINGLRLIIMRIRFRASDIGLVAKVTGFLCGDGARVILLFVSCDSAVRFLD